jgi:TPR repeat protein
MGSIGYATDYKKAMALYLRAGDLGFPEAHYSIGYAYYHGVEKDMKKAKYYYRLAAMGGCKVRARHNLGIMKAQDGNAVRA